MQVSANELEGEAFDSLEVYTKLWWPTTDWRDLYQEMNYFSEDKFILNY